MTSPAVPPRDQHPSAPPSVDVIGGGQLARMMAQAAVGLGVRLHLLAEGPDVSAAQVVPGAVVGDYRDLDASLGNQNFLVIAGTAACPSGNNTGLSVDVSTAPHQP